VVAVGCPPSGDEAATFGRVVAAVYAPSGGLQTLRYAFDEAHIRNAAVHVVHPVRAPRNPVGAEEHVLAGALIQLQAEYPTVRLTSSPQPGSLADVLAGVCTPRDLLVLGHRRRGLLTPHVLEAAVTDALHAAPCPVAVVHEPSETAIAAWGDALTERASATAGIIAAHDNLGYRVEDRITHRPGD
jgi:nucleotide-binding universal stress UspA family protein